MDGSEFKISINFEAAGSAGVHIVLRGDNDDKVTLCLTEKQGELLHARLTREFYVRCSKQKILSEIDEASSCSDLEELAVKYYLCDVCRLGDINFYGAKRVLKVVTETLYRYPKLRSRLCYIGSHHELGEILSEMEAGDKQTLNSFNLQYICTTENARNLGRLVRGILLRLISTHEDYVATAMCAFGLFDAVLLDRNDYKGYAYIKFVSELRASEASGFHPQGSHMPEYVVYHELGHLIDNLCNLSENEEFKTFYGSLSPDDIREGLSEYATVDEGEFIAEAFAEYICNPSPRRIAAAVGRIIDKAYAK